MKNLVDLHTHSDLCNHGFSSVTENIEYASSLGLQIYGISEHQPDKKGIGASNIVFHNGPRIIPDYYNGMRVLKGIELNILDDGSFDVSRFKVENLDYCIASIHGYVYDHNHTVKENTENYLRAIYTPYINILGHIDQPGFICDYEVVVKEAMKNNVLIELNEASLDPVGSRCGAREKDVEILGYCKKYNCPIILSSDAHIKYDIGKHDYSYELLKEMDFPDELIVNYDLDMLKKYIDFTKKNYKGE